MVNMGMMNMGKWWRDTDVTLSIKMAWQGKWKLSSDVKFIKWSGIIIFLHVSLALVVLIILVNRNPDLMEHWPALILHPTDCEKWDLNVVCVSVWLCGGGQSAFYESLILPN